MEEYQREGRLLLGIQRVRPPIVAVFLYLIMRFEEYQSIISAVFVVIPRSARLSLGGGSTRQMAECWWLFFLLKRLVGKKAKRMSVALVMDEGELG